MKIQMSFLEDLGIRSSNYGASYGEWIKNDKTEKISSISPINGEKIADIYCILSN
jgi:hypothetical protein